MTHVTLNAIQRALTRDLPPKNYIQHGDGYVQCDLGKQNIAILGIVGAERYRTHDDTPNAPSNYSFTNPSPYATVFSFDKIPYPSTTTTVQYGGLPEGATVRVAYDVTQFNLVNSSTSTTYAELLELRPRRDLAGNLANGVNDNINNNSAWASVGQNEADEQYHLSGGGFTGEVNQLQVGVPIYWNQAITEDWYIINHGIHAFEPGTNKHIELHAGGSYDYEVDSLGDVLYYSKAQTRVLLLRIWGETVAVTAGGSANTAPAKIAWTWVNKKKWQLQPLLQYGQSFIGSDTSLGTALAGTGARQVIAVSPGATATTTPTGVVPGVI